MTGKRLARAFACIAVLVLVPGPATRAQPAAPCEECTRGDALIEQFSLQELRSLAGELANMALADPVTEQQYARVVELRRRTPALGRLGALDDADHARIAAALCHAPEGECVTRVVRVLHCLAERCEVALPPPGDKDIVALRAQCHDFTSRRSTRPIGIGLDVGLGWQRSAYPADGVATSSGFHARVRLGSRLGLVARVDHATGSDAVEDEDGDRKDDTDTGDVVRLSALAGPSIVLDATRYDTYVGFLQLDLLGGYLATRSQRDERGPAAGADLAYQLESIRFGLRFIQGAAGAADASMLLAHFGIGSGAEPRVRSGPGCDPVKVPSSRLALGFELPVTGWGFSSQLGYMAIGLGLETKWYLSRKLDALLRADMFIYPLLDADRVTQQAVLAGLRIDHGTPRGERRWGLFSSVMAGYSRTAGVPPATSLTGPIIDLSLGYGLQGSMAATHLRLHGRFGVLPDNADFRAVFLSLGAELRLGGRY